MDSITEYNKKKDNLIKEFNLTLRDNSSVGLDKSTSNLFRSRNQKGNKKINVKNFNQVINVDVKTLTCDVEGMCTYEMLVDECLKYELMPCVVPELKSITIGGAFTGVGIESSSFKFGLVHETVLDIEVLLSSGEVIVCTRTNEHKDLFFGFPNSYGSLGYVLKLKIKLVPVKKYVKIEHLKYTDADEYFKDLKLYCERNENINFVDGTIFNENEMYITLGKLIDEAPFVSNYKYMKIYYKSIQEKKVDYLTVLDYIWRWDPDWFWCSMHFKVQNPIIRFLFGKFILRSTFYWKIMFLNRKYKLDKIFSRKELIESVIQDVEIPIENCVKFIDFFHREINIKPVWVCPVMAYDKKVKFDLYYLNPSKLYINFGFWDSVKTKDKKPEGYFNKLIEKKVKELNGKKSLYSDSYYSEEEFWKLYNKNIYFKLKKKYDSIWKFKNLFEKTVKRK